MSLISKCEKIKWRKGNGTMLFSAAILCVSFVAAISIMEIYNLYYRQSKLQTVTDVIADGAAVAGNTIVGFDKSEANWTAIDLLRSNRESIHTRGGLTIKNDTSNAKDKIIEGKFYTGRNPATEIGQDIKDELPDERKVLAARNKVKVYVSEYGKLLQKFSFAGQGNIGLGYSTTKEGIRNAAYVDWLIEYKLCPEYNKDVYQRKGVNNACYFIYDYIVSMGFDKSNTVTTNWETQHSSWLNSTLSSWSDITSNNAKQIQDIAETGKPVIALLYTKSGTFEAAVVVPKKGILSDGEIAIAKVGAKNDNYKRVNYNNLKSEYTVKVYTHD